MEHLDERLEFKVYQALKNGAKSWEDLTTQTGLTIKQVRQALASLESLGYIESEIYIKIVR